MSDLVSSFLALMDGPAQVPKRFHKELANEVGLQPARLGSLQLLAHLHHFGDVHRILDEGTLVDQLGQPLMIEDVVDFLLQLGADLGLVAVADSLDQEVSQPVLGEDPAQDVEDVAAERLALLIELFE